MGKTHPSALISIRGLAKTYRLGFLRNKVEALKGIDLTVQEGDLFGFIGPNGAGKSTTIKILLGLLSADRGEVALLGLPPSHPRSRLEVGYLPEQPYFYDYLTGRELLAFYGSLLGLSGRILKSRIEECAALTGMREDWLGRKLRTYSKGMMQRAGLAQALLSTPRLVILDEPMSGLDPMGRRDVRQLLQELHRRGTTIFYSSHVLGDVEAICNKVAMVVDGLLPRQGTVAEVLGEAKAQYHLHFAGLSAAAPPDLPQRPGLVHQGDGRFLAEDEAAKEELLRWAAAKGHGLIGLERLRPSLEDVLASEVAKR